MDRFSAHGEAGSTVSRWAARYPLGIFWCLACGISWILWLPLVAASFGVHLPTLPAHHFWGALGPCAAAVIVTGLTKGKAGIADLMRRIVRWRMKVKWYLIALAGPPALFAIAAIVSGFVSGSWVGVRQFGSSEEFPEIGILCLWLFHTVTFGFGEEIGWRGFALPRLQRTRGALVATLLLSAAWASWHWPTFLYRPGYSSMDLLAGAGWFMSIVTGAILLTWLYNSTGGSVLIVSLFHGSIDVVFTSKEVGRDMMNMMGTLIVLWALLVLVLCGPDSLSCDGKQVDQT
ncbi:MAG: CPBP family intramembrane metalloprotease [Nitrospira sp.]|nr:CPBP family intramembrane metalloprotease [Nitrospira sp.]